MNLPLLRYPLDITGKNPDNFISGETHSLINRPSRALAPTYGAYFTESIKIYDNATNLLLVRGDQYLCTELIQVATELYGKEICYLVIITDPSVSSLVRIDYQCLGGPYNRSADAIINMYDLIHRDDRPISWPDIMDKPDLFNPSLHLHDIGDVYGFEYLVAAMERIRGAIILSDVPAYERLLSWIDATFASFRQTLQTQTDLNTAHFSNIDNPHLVSKSQIGLSLVSNLTVATPIDVNFVINAPIGANQNVISQDKYITLRTLLLYRNGYLDQISNLTNRIASLEEGVVLGDTGSNIGNVPLPIEPMAVLLSGVTSATVNNVIPFYVTISGLLPNVEYAIHPVITSLTGGSNKGTSPVIQFTSNENGANFSTILVTVDANATTGVMSVSCNVFKVSNNLLVAVGNTSNIVISSPTVAIEFSWSSWNNGNLNPISTGSNIEILGSVKKVVPGTFYITKLYIRKAGTLSNAAGQVVPIIQTVQASSTGEIPLDIVFALPENIPLGTVNIYTELWNVADNVLLGRTSNIAYNVIALVVPTFVWVDNLKTILPGEITTIYGNLSKLAPNTAYSLHPVLIANGVDSALVPAPGSSSDISFATNISGNASISIVVRADTGDSDATGLIIYPEILKMSNNDLVMTGPVAYVNIPRQTLIPTILEWQTIEGTNNNAIRIGDMVTFSGSATGLTTGQSYEKKFYFRRIGSPGVPVTNILIAGINNSIALTKNAIIPVDTLVGTYEAFTTIWADGVLILETDPILLNVVLGEATKLATLSSNTTVPAPGDTITLTSLISGMNINTQYKAKFLITPNGWTGSTWYPNNPSDQLFTTNSTGAAIVVTSVTFDNGAAGNLDIKIEVHDNVTDALEIVSLPVSISIDANNARVPTIAVTGNAVLTMGQTGSFNCILSGFTPNTVISTTIIVTDPDLYGSWGAVDGNLQVITVTTDKYGTGFSVFTLENTGNINGGIWSVTAEADDSIGNTISSVTTGINGVIEFVKPTVYISGSITIPTTTV